MRTYSNVARYMRLIPEGKVLDLGMGIGISVRQAGIRELKLLLLFEGKSLDIGDGEPHYHGSLELELVARKAAL